MCASWWRRGKAKRRKGAPQLISPLRQRARDAAEALNSDNAGRWFPAADVFPVYNYFYDYFQGRPEDVRMRTVTAEALARLEDLAQRLEANTAIPLPAEWAQARQALAEASQVFKQMAGAW